ncbi:hypothetical protein ACVR05_06795 [Streptococcus caprae]|uniref:DUF2207 domain-containing protein n=1 Tax=Streptococcus caprae TaxID=1640501 RepID=A0ABV8CVW4_9STRE
MLSELFELLSHNSSFLDSITTNIMEFRDDGTFKYQIQLLSINKEETLLLQNSLGPFDSQGNMTIHINDFHIKDKPEISEKNKIALTISQKYLPDETIYLFLEKDFPLFERKFLEKCCFKDLVDYQNKITIEFPENNIDICSPIFSTLKNDSIQIPKIFLENKNFQQISLFATPYLVNSNNISKYASHAIDGLLDILSERRISDDEIIISFNRNSILDRRKIILNQSTFDNLYYILNFIFSEREKYYDRLIIFKDLFSVLANENDELSDKEFEKLSKKLKSNYTLFITDKMKSYMDDKNKLTEEYAKIHSETIAGIRTVINDLTQQITVLSGTILAFLLFDGIENITKILISSIVAMLYLVIINFVNHQKGWYFESEAILKNKQHVKSMYQVLSSVEQEFIQSLDSDFDKDLDKLKRIEKFNKYFCLILLFVSFLVLLWA